MARWLDRRARKRYARSYKDVRAARNDAVGIAIHLRESLPNIFEYEGQAGYAGWPSSITPARLLRDPAVDIPLTPYDEVITNAAKLGGVVFWFTDKNVEAGDAKRFAVVIVEEPADESGEDADGDVDPPAFATEVLPTPAFAPATTGSGELDNDDDVDQKVERDCSE